MVMLLLGDSQVERVWPTVRLDREVLRDAIFIPVKNRQAIMTGYQSITAAVSEILNVSYDPYSVLEPILFEVILDNTKHVSLDKFVEISFYSLPGLF